MVEPSGEKEHIEWRAERVWTKHHERIPDRWEWLIEDDHGALAIIVEDDYDEAKANALLIARTPDLRAENERLCGALAEAVHFLGCTMRNGIDLPNRKRGYNRDRAWAFLREHEAAQSDRSEGSDA